MSTMKKGSTIIVPEDIQKLSSESINNRKQQTKSKIAYCLSFLTLASLVMYSVVAIYFLKIEVDILREKIYLMEKRDFQKSIPSNIHNGPSPDEKERQNIDVSYDYDYYKMPLKSLSHYNDYEYSTSKENNLLKDSADSLEEDNTKEQPDPKGGLHNDNYLLGAPLHSWTEKSNGPDILSHQKSLIPEFEEKFSLRDFFPFDYNFHKSSEDTVTAKMKREIRDSHETPTEGEFKVTVKNDDKENNSSKEKHEKYSSGISLKESDKSLEVSSKEKSNSTTSKFIETTRKPHQHKKHKKSRIGSAERFFTETYSTTSAPIQVRKSRTKPTQHHNDDKAVSLRNQKLLQHTAANKDTISKEALRKEYRRYVELDDEQETSKQQGNDSLGYNMITMHFSADTSHYSKENDPHYFGNGRMRIKSDVYKDWKPAHWTQGVGMSKYFNLHEGRVSVSITGIYLIYAQIQYSNTQEVNGFSVFRNEESVVQCITTSTHHDKQEIRSNTCAISTTTLLQSNDTIYIKDLHHGRYVVLTPEKSYFGLVLLSPFKN